MDSINNKLEKPIFSIIIPHKNIPDLLKRCLNSIPTRKDLEVIVVDDNSREDVKKNISSFENPGTTIVYTHEGKGAGYARNVGLSKAQGRWIIFADADDFFTDQFNKALDKHKDNICEIIFFKICSCYCDTLLPSDRGNFINNMIDKAKKENPDQLRYKRLEPWAKFIKRDYVQKNNILFDETPAANDLFFSLLSGFYASIIDIDTTPIYCLTQREGSLAYAKTRNICEAKIDVIKKVNQFLIDNNLSEYHINIYPYILNCKSVSKKMFIFHFMKSFGYYKKKIVIKDFFKSIISYIRKNR